MSSRAAFAMALVLVFHSSLPAQSPGSIQGVWRPVSRTIPATANPGDRSDPFAHVPVGTQTDLQPGLMIFTARHYSRTTDTATAPRPTSADATPGKPTARRTPGAMGTLSGERRHLRAGRQHADAALDGFQEPNRSAERQLRPPHGQDGRRSTVAHADCERGRSHRCGGHHRVP